MDNIENKIRKFFNLKKSKSRFQAAGPGRKLTDPAPSTSQPPKRSGDVYIPPKRNELSAEARAAADAAMARVQKKDSRNFNTSLSAIQAQVRRELEAEKRAKQEAGQTFEQKCEKDRTNLAVQGVYFRCPMISNEILTSKEWRLKIKEFLYDQLEDEMALTASLIIHNCNMKDKAEQCIETLTKYLENITNHPNDEKYRKIRMTNRIFAEKVKIVEGGREFLIGAGFAEQEIDGEMFLIYSSEDVSYLGELVDALKNAEKIKIDLDRNIQVLLPSQAKKSDLPLEFFRITPEEIRKEQQLRTEAVENAQILRTKAMRDREEHRALNIYKFSLIRVRFPDGVILQGTFSVYEKLSHVYEFVTSCLKDEAFEYTLISPVGARLGDDELDKTLYDLRLIPNSILMFTYTTNTGEPHGNYLKEEILMLIQSV
ncbi:UBX domain-containing protein 6 [Pseudolycoriella hygida]|uniref:UBX domain-containing protein 6 n=1 Tax=Pseudolycoriella hygida TaxID=35572 RepID=A0A9Q0N087_9DIPT|nr:UBX domain-containing protein 6 [Pseudolycoriella hygida]